MSDDKFDGTDNRRVSNNPDVPPHDVPLNEGMAAMRMMYRALSDDEKALMCEVKTSFAELWARVDRIGHSRDLSLAKTHLEDSCMRVVRHITK